MESKWKWAFGFRGSVVKKESDWNIFVEETKGFVCLFFPWKKAMQRGGGWGGGEGGGVEMFLRVLHWKIFGTRGLISADGQSLLSCNNTPFLIKSSTKFTVQNVVFFFFFFFLIPQRHRPPKKPYRSLTGTLAPGDECD